METPAQSRPAAPAVVAVVVTRNPGPWFDESVRALAAQDYPNLAALYLDAGSDVDPTPRINETLPDALVHRLEENRGYGWAANHAATIVEGATYYCFLHDDAAPEPAAIRTLVAEALRSNAGIVGAKLVTFGDHRRLLQVGESIDKTGERSSAVDPGEIDQEQHDAVRDVFVVPGGCILVRADLFEAIGRFDEGIDLLNDDLNLCWRAHVAGSRVVVAPDAVVGHVEALGARSDATGRRERLIRHRLRTMLSCYSRWHLARVLPQAAVVAVLEVVYSVLAGRSGQAGDVVRAWRWNWSRRGEIAEWRRRVAGFRGVHDSEIRPLQLRGSARFRAFVRGQSARGGTRSDHALARWNTWSAELRSGRMWWSVAAWGLTVVIVTFGSRHLVFRDIAAVAGFPAFEAGPRELFDRFLSGWRDSGLGSASPAPTAQAILAVLGTLFVGAMGLLRKVLILGPLVFGLVGSYRLLRPTGSTRAQAVALVVYAATPVAYNAIADARWGALAVYALCPWLVAFLGRAGGWPPFADPDRAASTVPVRGRAVQLGVVVGAIGAFDPAVVVVVLGVVVGLVAGSVLSGSGRGSARLALTGVAGLGVALVLNMPWTFDFLVPGARWEAVTGVRGAEPTRTLAELLSFDVGPVGGSAVSILVPVAALLPLLIGREWRYEWAVRAWTTSALFLGLTWAGSNGHLPVALPAAEMLLAPAAIGLAVAAGLGVVAFEQDLRAYGFGWRQLVAAAAGIALLIGSIPTVVDAGGGRWNLASGDLDTTFAFLGSDEPGFRVLWLGDADVVPVPGFRWETGGSAEGLVYATSIDGLPTVTDFHPPSEPGTSGLIEDALAVALDHRTSRLGRMLAPMAIRYIVVPSAAAPKPLGGLQRPVPAAVGDMLAAQLDLAAVPVNPAYTVYENRAVLPARAGLGASAGESPAVAAADLVGAVPVLPEVSGPTTWSGPIVAGSRVLASVGADPGWELLVDGRAAPARRLFGWAQGFEPVTSGPAELRFDTEPVRYLMLLVQGLVWVVALRLSWRWWRTARRTDDDAEDEDEDRDADVNDDGDDTLGTGSGVVGSSEAPAPSAADDVEPVAVVEP